MKPKKKTKKPKLKLKKISLNPIKLFTEALKGYRLQFGWLMKISLTVAVPASLLRLTGQGGSPDLNYLASIAGLFLTLALVIVATKGAKPKTKLSVLYNQASSYFLRYVGLGLVQSIVALPLVLSLLLIVLALSLQFGFWPILALLGLAGVIFFGLLLLRVLFGVYFLVAKDSSVVESIRLSWRATAKRSWRILFALLPALFAIVVSSGLAITLANLLPFVNQNDFANTLISGVLLGLILPLLILYVGGIFERIK